MRRFLKKVIWKLNLIKNFFFKNRKYLIKKKEFNNILKYGSNHPRRVDYFKFGHVFKEKNNVLDFFNPWLLRTRENVINIVFGDSHSEFNTRLFKDLLIKNEILPILSLSIHTGATTLIGSLLSSCFYENNIKNIKLLLNEVLIRKKGIEKVNIIISLGEIDVRTKVGIESIRDNKSYKEILDKYIDKKLTKKLIYFQDQLKDQLPSFVIKLFFLIPPPPSPDRFFEPTADTQIKNINEFMDKFPYPNLYDLNVRLEIYKYFVDLLKLNCKKANIRYIENSEYIKLGAISKENSHDLCHISKGKLALTNSYKIYWLE